MPNAESFPLTHDPLMTADAGWVAAATDGYLDAALDHLRVLGAPDLHRPSEWSPASRAIAAQTVLALVRRVPLVTLDGPAVGRTLWEVSHDSTLTEWDGVSSDHASALTTAARAASPVEVLVEDGAPTLHRAA